MSDGQQSPPGQRKPARNRERNINLRKYYGIGASAGETRQPYDIDGSTFEPNKYFARLLKEKSLNGLVAKDNELVAEIREIDGDMKTLVYENYNKFISATDTIRKMKSNVENMESEMRHLDENVSSISKQCAEISQALGPNREKIKRLTTAHNMLKRLQFMFDLPNRLNYCLANRQYAQAVKYYTRATRLLEHYHHMAAFKGIERDCIAITEKIKMQLWENMAGKDTVTEAAKLLLSLNEDKRKVWKRYLEVQDDNLKKESEGWDSITVVQELKDIVLVRLDTTVTNFKDLFLQEQDTSNIETAQKDLVQVIKPYLEHFFKIASVLLDADSNISSSDDAADSRAKRMQILTALRNAISDHGKSLSMTTDIDARMNDLGILWETQLISSLMQYTTAQLKARTFELATLKLSNDLNDSIVAAESWLLQCIEDKFLGPLHKCLQAQPADEHRRAFTDRVRESLGRLWLNVLNIFSTLQDAEESNRELALLLGSRLCYYFGENGIERVYGNYPDFSSHDTQASITDNFLKKGQSLLNEKVMEEGYDLSRKIQHHYINSRASVDLEEKPTQVSSVWQTISDRLGQIEHVVETIYPQQAPADGPSELADADFEYRFHDGLYTRPAQSTHSLATAASDTQGLGIIPRFGFDIDMNMNMMSNIDKLFAERVDIYRQVEPTPAGVVSGLLHILLKTFYETVRLARVQTSDYQQVQIDVEYLRFVLWPYAQKENKWMESILQEIVSSAYLRCPEPVPLEHEDMERILSPYYSPTSNIVNTQQNEPS